MAAPDERNACGGGSHERRYPEHVRLPLAVCFAWIVGGPDDGCLSAFEGAPPVDEQRRD